MMHRSVWVMLVLAAIGVASALADGAPSEKAAEAKPEGKSVYDFTMKDIDGSDVKLADYKGKVCLIVNVASQ